MTDDAERELLGLPDRSKKKSISRREKEILWYLAKKKCEGCGRKLDFPEMEVGHKRAASKGGSATLRNSACLCPTCNKLQRTEGWHGYMKKMGTPERIITATSKPYAEIEKLLKHLTLANLKDLAKKHYLKVKSREEKGWFSSSIHAPTKSKFISKLKGVVKKEEITALLDQPKIRKKRKAKKCGWFGI